MFYEMTGTNRERNQIVVIGLIHAKSEKGGMVLKVIS